MSYFLYVNYHSILVADFWGNILHMMLPQHWIRGNNYCYSCSYGVVTYEYTVRCFFNTVVDGWVETGCVLLNDTERTVFSAFTAKHDL